LAFQVTVAGAVAFAAYGIYRAWTDYLDPSAAERDEQRVLSTPIIKGNPIVFFDLEVDGEALGRVVFQLRKVSVGPRAATDGQGSRYGPARISPPGAADAPPRASP